jgi:hypothetical protein
MLGRKKVAFDFILNHSKNEEKGGAEDKGEKSMRAGQCGF